MTIAIRGIGVVGGFGCGIDALLSALSSEDRIIQNAAVRTAQGTRQLPVYRGDTSRLGEFTPMRNLRRMDHYSKLALLGSYLALQDAGKLDDDRSKMGIIIATGYGASATTFAFLDSFIKDGDNLSSPTSFSSSVQNAAVANVSMLLGIRGPGLTVSQFEMSVPSALLAARNWIESGRADSVLFGAVDEYCDVLGYCWHRFFGDWSMDDTGIKPFAFNDQSAIPGEGAAFFLLSDSRTSDPSSYGYITMIELERFEEEIPMASDENIIIAGADGDRACGGFYEKYLSKTVQTASYTPLYGSLPIGSAFDIAIASLSTRRGEYFCNGGQPLINKAYDTKPLGGKALDCVKISRSKEFGIVRIGSSFQ